MFSVHSSGTNLIRTTTVGGQPLQIKTGHGYYRPHTGPGGKVTDLQLSGLTVDEIKTAIAADVEAFLLSGGILPVPGSGFTGPLRRTLAVGGIMIEYRAVESPEGYLDVPTYYQF